MAAAPNSDLPFADPSGSPNGSDWKLGSMGVLDSPSSKAVRSSRPCPANQALHDVSLPDHFPSNVLPSHESFVQHLLAISGYGLVELGMRR